MVSLNSSGIFSAQQHITCVKAPIPSCWWAYLVSLRLLSPRSSRGMQWTKWLRQQGSTISLCFSY